MENKEKEQSNKEALINETNRMLKDIAMYNLRFNEFEKYYNVMESLVANGLTKLAGDFAIALNNASVVLNNPDDREKYKVYKEKLEPIVVDRARKYIEESGINVSEIFEDMKKRVLTYKLSFERYCYYYDLLKVSYTAKLEDLDYLEIAKDLQSAQVEDVNTLDDTKAYNHNQTTLLLFIAKLSEKDKKR